MVTQYTSLWEVMSRYKWRYAVGVLALLVTDLALQVLPRVSGRFFDDLKGGTLTEVGIWRSLGLVMGAALVIVVSRFLWRFFVFGTARYVEQDLRSALFAQLLRLPASFYHQHKTGDLMAMATNDLQAVRGVSGEGILMSADATMLTLITLTAMTSSIGWRLSALALIPLPFLAIAALMFGRFMHVRYRAVQDTFGKLSDVTQENIGGMRVVKAFGQELAEEAKFDVANRTYVAKFMSMVRVHGIIEPTIQLLAGICFVLAIIFPGRAALRGEIQLGAFVSLTMYIGMLIWPMLAMGWMVNIFQRGSASFRRIREVLVLEPEAPSSANVEIPQVLPLSGRLEFKNLTFQYPGKRVPALDGVNITAQPGQTIGIIGRTGSGKSTLVALLARVFNPPRGTIFVDGADVLDIPLAALRESIAFVPQEAFLFSRTVGQNIGLAPGDWTESQIHEAARSAQVETDILEFLPQGYETMVGERGVTLSGGQRQRVGLSRAMLKNAPILVLDDCMSAVDTNTEARILSGLRPIMKERTTVVISHRVAAVRAADQIIVLENGRIVEAGNHEQLLNMQGRYYRTHQRQQLEESIASVE